MIFGTNYLLDYFTRKNIFSHDFHSSPPFQITKRGWGEFPVRVQLYFHEHLGQKPLQIFHTIILDKKHTGLQTMGEFFGTMMSHMFISLVAIKLKLISYQ